MSRRGTAASLGDYNAKVAALLAQCNEERPELAAKLHLASKAQLPLFARSCQVITPSGHDLVFRGVERKKSGNAQLLECRRCHVKVRQRKVHGLGLHRFWGESWESTEPPCRAPGAQTPSKSEGAA